MKKDQIIRVRLTEQEMALVKAIQEADGLDYASDAVRESIKARARQLKIALTPAKRNTNAR